MRFSILIPTLQRPVLLQKLLESIRVAEKTTDITVFIIDNIGDRETKKICESMKEYLSVNYLVSPKIGKNIALNFGIKHTESEYLIFLMMT